MPQITATASQIKAELSRRKQNKFDYWFMDTGEFPRSKYVKHLEFFAASASYREIVMMAANRAGKTESGAYAMTCHLTGYYPTWWVGKRFQKPINAIAAGETGKLVRDSIQVKLLGPASDVGTGMIPLQYISDKRSKSGIPDAYDLVYVKHKSGGMSVLQFQSYDQGREAFQATERDVVWFDEEPPLSVYSEGLMRTMTTNGIVMSTFTPLKGVSETVLNLQEKQQNGLIHITIATWDDAPHLSEKDKTELMASLPPHQRDARSKGVPALGSGAVYKVPETDFLCDGFEIPKHYRQLYGMDVGWNNTACAWGSLDPETGIVYITSDYKRGQCEPAVHASAIRQRGQWVTGAIDPASRGRAQHDGEQLIELYRGQGLDLVLADNAVEAGVFDVYERLSTGKLKVFRNCTALLEEYRLYRRDEKGKIVKQNDHIMDALRYLVRGIEHHGSTKPIEKEEPEGHPYNRRSNSGWMS